LLIPIINGQQQARPCGTMRSYFSTESRIVGGEAASDYAWPWQVYITYKGQFICGGTLVDKRHVVTAGHCILSNNAKDFRVRVGAHSMVRRGYLGTLYRVSSVNRNENYADAENGYDIAIISLAYPIGVSDTVNVICLPTDSNLNVPTYSPVVITGFGLTTEDGSLPNTLQQAIIQLLPACNDAYPSFNSATQLCAGLQGGGKDTCQGDSGGPLIYQPHKSEQWVLIGITSYGNGCARVNYPGVYTKVSSYLDWIKQTIAKQ